MAVIVVVLGVRCRIFFSPKCAWFRSHVLLFFSLSLSLLQVVVVTAAATVAVGAAVAVAAAMTRASGCP